jgi:hypothetical protein
MANRGTPQPAGLGAVTKPYGAGVAGAGHMTFGLNHGNLRFGQVWSGQRWSFGPAPVAPSLALY